MSIRRSVRRYLAPHPESGTRNSAISTADVPEPPLLPADVRPHAPDFIGIGAQKCGTTWWHKMISEHPGVYDDSHLKGKVTPGHLHKERHFFNPFFAGTFQEEDSRRYHNWCASPEGLLSGEWTPRYLCEHWAPPLVKRTAPDARLIVLLRDPIDRYESGMRHAAKFQSPLTDDIAMLHFFRGLYFQQIQHWLNFFPRDQMLFLQYEKCKRKPEDEYRKTLDFLGLEAFALPTGTSERKLNETRNKEVFSIEEGSKSVLANAYREDVTQLFALLPELDSSLWNDYRAG